MLDLYGSVCEVTMNRNVKDPMVSSLVPSTDITESVVLTPTGAATAQDTVIAAKEYVSGCAETSK